MISGQPFSFQEKRESARKEDWRKKKGKNSRSDQNWVFLSLFFLLFTRRENESSHRKKRGAKEGLDGAQEGSSAEARGAAAPGSSLSRRLRRTEQTDEPQSEAQSFLARSLPPSWLPPWLQSRAPSRLALICLATLLLFAGFCHCVCLYMSVCMYVCLFDGEASAMV